jgi:nucleotide-binding universal stress UspA family protein
MNVLIAIDESPYSKAALDAVLERPWAVGTKFNVITVVEPFHPEYAGWQTNYVPLAMEAQKAISAASSLLIEEAKAALSKTFGADNVLGEVHEGYIKERILEVSRDWAADLIVVGSHGRRGFTKFLLGSVSEAIASHANCSVEIVRLKEHASAGHTGLAASPAEDSLN